MINIIMKMMTSTTMKGLKMSLTICTETMFMVTIIIFTRTRIILQNLQLQTWGMITQRSKPQELVMISSQLTIDILDLGQVVETIKTTSMVEEEEMLWLEVPQEQEET